MSTNLVGRGTIFLIIFTFIGVSVLLYISIDKDQIDWQATKEREIISLNILKKLEGVELGIDQNNDMISKVRANLQKHERIIMEYERNERNSKLSIDEGNVAVPPSMNNERTEDAPRYSVENARMREMNICDTWHKLSQPSSEILIPRIYDTDSFEDTDGGVWKQGFDLSYDASDVQNQPTLEVVVVPHSHTDPGWLRTFEEYFSEKTVNIFENMLQFLQQYPDMRFVYAEISFFDRWWRKISDKKRDKVKELLKDGRLEILTGAWVMTDEANAHYFSMITQLMEGHEWIVNNIGKDYKPRNHWSIDPFGLSPTMAFLLNRAELKNGVTQRVHYTIKKRLAIEKQLEFYWRQNFDDGTNHSDFLFHIMPFYSYDVPHTCGPDPKVCCQFDFFRRECPWKLAPKRITPLNVAERAKLLYDQYRKKSQLYRTNVVFIPLGDDFRYDSAGEWDAQYKNYKQLFDYMNSQSSWNVHARFGTVDEYFELMHAALNAKSAKLPSLSGDFFTYADRNDHYWSGYYTSRPFYKRMDRVLQHYLRSAEILFSFMDAAGMNQKNAASLFPSLVEARRYLSLFQHHDGITGTAKAAVVRDYGSKLLLALTFCDKIISIASEALLFGSKSSSARLHPLPLILNEQWKYDDVLPETYVAESNKEIILFNSLTRERSEVVCINVNSPDLIVENSEPRGKAIRQQIGPRFVTTNKKLILAENAYELCFHATVPALALAKFCVVESPRNVEKASIMAVAEHHLGSSVFQTKVITGNEFELSNEFFTAVFNVKSGFLEKIKPYRSSAALHVELSFVQYGARLFSPHTLKGGDDRSGAYLFLPDGPAKPVTFANDYVVVRGPVMSKVVVFGENSFALHHSSILFDGTPYIHINNVLNIEKTNNFELAMRLTTSVNSGNEVFTDLNGYQMIKRKRYAKLPIQANFYPMSSAAFIQDEDTRVSLLTAQPLGVASLESGWLEVMLDRRLGQSDNRGLDEGVMDSFKVSDEFRLMVEHLHSDPMRSSTAQTAYHSMASHWSSLSMNYPLILMFGDGNKERANSFIGLREQVSSDIHMVNLRTLYSSSEPVEALSLAPRTSQALVLHRFVVDCSSMVDIGVKCISDGNFKISALKLDNFMHAINSTLTLLYRGVVIKNVISIDPMDVRTVILNFS